MRSTTEMIDLLKHFKSTSAHKYGIRSLGIFGSFARNQQNEKAIWMYLSLYKSLTFLLSSK